MSRAESLLNSLVRTGEVSLTSPINDTIVIDAEGRIINVPGTEILFGVEHDANIERKHFQCPRFVGDNVDLTTLGLRIVYQNANNEKDAYIVEDVKADGETITFSWLLGEKVLRTKGTVYFTICAVNVDAEGNETRHWNTTLASGTVLEGMEFDGLYPDEEDAARDVLQQLLNIFESKGQETIRSVVDEGTRQKAYLEEKAFGAMVKQTTERDTLLTVEDAADFRIVDLGFDGKTEQYTTTGKNLFDYDTYIAQGKTIRLDVEANKVLYRNGGLGQIALWGVYDAENNLIGTFEDYKFTSSKSLTLPVNASYIYASNDDVSKTFYIGYDSDTTYESYTGGIPSPNTEFEQSVVHAGKVELTVCNNNNLLDENFLKDKNNYDVKTLVSSGYYIAKVPVGARDTVTVSIGQKSDVGFMRVGNMPTTNGTDWLTHPTAEMSLVRTFDVLDGYVYFLIKAVSDISALIESVGYIQIDNGLIAKPHNPHESQKVTLTPPRAFTKWDRLVKKDGLYQWAFKSAERIEDGTGKLDATFLPSIILPKVSKKGTPNIEGKFPKYGIYCNYARNLRWSNTQLNTIEVKLDDLGLETVEEFKTFLAQKAAEGNPFTYWYETEAEEFVPLLPEEQEALKALETYRGVTHIWNDQNTPNQITYVADPEMYINRKLSELPQSGMDETQFTESLADAGFITILTDENGNTLTDENGNTLIAKGPEANHNPDWNETDESSPSFILNKPTGMGGGYTYYVISNNRLYKTSNPSEANDSNLIKNIKTFEQDYLSGPIMLHTKYMADDRTYFPCIAFAISDQCYVNYTYPGANVSKVNLSYDRNTGNLI